MLEHGFHVHAIPKAVTRSLELLAEGITRTR
jgi:hypothetical protein